MGDKSLVNTTATKIHLFWESFTKAEINTYERGAWFDLFLAEALLQLQDGKTPAEIISLTSNNVSSVLTNEIVADIKNICSQCCEDDDFGPIQNHFLCGRGWRSIALLHALGVQEVNCAGELTNLLTSIYGVEEGHSDNVNPFVIQKPLPNIEQVCRFRLSAKIKSRTFSLSSGIEGSPPGPTRKISTSSYSKRIQKQEKIKIKNTSDSEAVENETHKSHSLKIWLDPMDFDYFTCVVRSDDEQFKKSLSCHPPFFKKKSKKVIPEDFKDERISKVFKEEMSSYQFRVLVVEILQGLCQLDNPGNNLLINCFNFSLEQICSLQFSAIPNNSKQVEELKYGMTRLFLCALDKVLLQPDAINAIVYKGALPIMLRLLEDGITKAQCNKKHNALLQDFIFGVIYAVINLIHSLLLQHNNPDKLETFFPHFQQFVNSYNGRLIDKTVLCIVKYSNSDNKDSLNRVRKIIGLLSQLILSFKQIRTKFVHLRSCKKVKHKSCRYPIISHHHDNVFGKVYTNSVFPNPGISENNCAITGLFMIFTRFITEQMGREITITTMQAMMQCGTCCCFPAPTLISRILKVIQQSDTKVRNLGLLLLEKTIYREVGAIDLVTMCQVCLNVEEKDKSFADLTKHRWACLEAFQDMLLSTNYKVAYTIGSHLMRVTPRCSIQVQREMFFGVFYPVFLATKKRYEKSKTEKDKLTTTVCLSAFTNLLGRMRFADEFLYRSTVNHIFDLIKDRNFTYLCCLIIEMIIMIRVWKLEKQNINDILDENIGELKTLMDFVLEYTNEFHNTMKMVQMNTKKENGKELLFNNDTEWNNYIKILEKLGLFWKSWMNLCLYCPQIRVFFNRHLSMQCYTLLIMFLQHIAKNIRIKEGSKNKTCNQLHLKLLESLIVLSVVVPYSGNPGGIFGLKGKLEQVVEGSLGLRQICDVLIRCSGANPCKRIMIPTHPMPKLDIELGLASALEDNNSDSSLENSADEGYDADIDLPCRKVQERDCVSGKSSFPPSRRISSMLGDRRCCLIAHPILCHIVLHLIVKCYRKDKWVKECVYSLYKLSSSLRDNPENSVRLSRIGFNLELLQHFSELLISDKPENREMQSAVLELFDHLAKYNINSQELATYLGLFITEKPPLNIILPCLLKLMNGMVQQPKYIICFPTKYSNANLVNTTPAHKLGITLHQNHISTGAQSCWSRSALFLPLNAELGWAMWVQGFSFSLWLRLEPVISSDSSEQSNDYAESSSSESGRSSGLDEIDINHLLHIVSIGYEAHVLEFWADTSRELLHVRLTRPDGDKQEVLSEVSLEGRLTVDVWHHLAISVRDSVHNAKVVIEVTLIIDGWCEVQVPLAFKGILVRKSRATNVLIGDTRHGIEDGPKLGKWQFGGLVMFRKPVLDKKAGIWLTAMGPDCYNMTQSRIGNIEPAWHAVFNSKTLTAGIPWNDLLDKNNIMKELQESVLLSFSAKSPDTMNVYPLASATSSGLGGGFRVIGMEQRSSQLVPMFVSLVMYCNPISQNCCALTSSIDNLGGLAVFAFLFARVVELGGSELEQAQALELFLRLSHSQPSLKSQSCSYLPLIRYVIESDICCPGPYMLKAILDSCCDKPGLISVFADKLQVTTQGDFLLTEPFVVTKLILGPTQAWLGTLPMFLQALLMLLRDDHPYREFNSNQLNRANALDSLLNFCKARLVEDHAKLDPPLCTSLVDVIRGLMTAPPQLHHLSALADYLLLAHANYISHARSSLYFVLPPRPPSKTPRKARKSSNFFDRMDLNEYRGLFAQPVDPGKLNKALTNLQIKQGGKHFQRMSLDSIQKDEVVCDSGIEGSCRGNTTDSEHVQVQNCDQLSNISANTYFMTNVDLDEGSAAENSSSSTDEDEKYIKDNKHKVSEVEEGDDCITIGLLDLLRDQILVMPDNLAHTALPNVLIPESFIAMANQGNNSITTAVVQVLTAYLARATVEERNRFIKFKGFDLLAMQLSHIIPTLDLVDALTRNVYYCFLNFESNALTEEDLSGLPPLLSILPKSVANDSIAHRILECLLETFLWTKDWKKMLEYGLVEALLKTLVNHQKNNINDHDERVGRFEDYQVNSDIETFFTMIALYLILKPGSNNVQIFSEIIMKIEYVYGLENRSCGEGSECCVAIKRIHCSFLQSSLKYLEENASVHRLLSLNGDYFQSSTENSFKGKLSKSELAERFKCVVSKATEFVVYTEPVNDETSVKKEEMRKFSAFAKEVWLNLLFSLVIIVETSSWDGKSLYVNAVWSCRECIRNLGVQMFLWLLSPLHSKELKMFTIQSVLNEPRSKDVLVYIISNTQLEKMVALFLWDIRYGTPDISERDGRMCDELIFKIEEWCGNSVLGLMNGNVTDKSGDLVMDACVDASLARKEWHNQHVTQIHKVVYRHESLVNDITERAIAVTKEVDAAQSHQKKLLLESIKTGFGAKVQAVFKWKEIVTNLTHECAVWHFPKSYPRSWELDPTEGPARVRSRLRRCHLNMDNKYFKSEFNLKPQRNQPLNFIFEGTLSTSTALIDRLHSNTKIRHMCKASVISPDHALPGELLIGHCYLYFVPVSDNNTMEWSFHQIKEIHKRRFELQERALELFLMNGKTYLIAFETQKERDVFMGILCECDLTNRVATEQLGTTVQMWRENQMTNWQYLTILNTLSGRSYNDLMQYPVLPFILSDYVSPVLDLTDLKSFRNLMKPMAIQEKKNEAHYISNYRYLKTELTDALNVMAFNHEPYHYSSHYSNSGIVLHFLVRLPPFTNMFLNYQDNNFDCPDRTFHSLHTTWRFTSSESATDVKELVPEFFFLPEFLLNREGFNFGTRQNGETVDNVILPPWAKNPRLFILIHRQALESEHVTEFLPHWIDLVFGYKQTGKEAIQCINVFHPATYSGFDPESIVDPLIRSAWKTMVRMYGQTPKQLFEHPHPLVVKSLMPTPVPPPVIPSVKGLSWGHYVGSPGDSPPLVIGQHHHYYPIASLVALLSNDVFGLAANSTLLLSYIKETTVTTNIKGPSAVLGAALISWGHGDGIIRAKLTKDQVPFPAIAASGETILFCLSVPDCNQLWVAYTSGKINIYMFRFDGLGKSLEFEPNPVTLVGHRSVISNLAISGAFSVAVSVSHDGSAIIWDINTLTYIRSLPSISIPISLVSISETLGDIATVAQDPGGGSSLRLHSINASLVGDLMTEDKITALTFSSAPEGISVNIIATGMSDGVIRLWSTWDLTPVGIIATQVLSQPIICLTYSQDSQHLYASTAEGLVVIWQGSSIKSSAAVPRFLNLTSFP